MESALIFSTLSYAPTMNKAHGHKPRTRKRRQSSDVFFLVLRECVRPLLDEPFFYFTPFLQYDKNSCLVLSAPRTSQRGRVIISTCVRSGLPVFMYVFYLFFCSVKSEKERASFFLSFYFCCTSTRSTLSPPLCLLVSCHCLEPKHKGDREFLFEWRRKDRFKKDRLISLLSILFQAVQDSRGLPFFRTLNCLLFFWLSIYSPNLLTRWVLASPTVCCHLFATKRCGSKQDERNRQMR